ncbi:putative O-glycosylation ligase, exosortase A system-associated [Roseomonas frigidaquae]|uniref:O-glycosylation ligase, exosortase A system-associated n=1 Tax=Falsiroseomonas frigidaquae TaxID=487318 RepID=A0ABX1EV81_9PROT|nr:putative O-glycosylation ligase, exosortase A system-associated [Falsiroseomonas frigidaquae]NKE44028.1 putative O-glycosylation ligase, exosortase A system-associated [Falsiroseomonas frigidaquae]
MLRSLYLIFVYCAFLGLGALAPFVLSLGYVWVDTFRPQQIAYILLNQFPVSAFIGALAIGGYLAADRRSPAPFGMHAALTLLFAGWITLTTVQFAVAPEAAWDKWDWAFKTVLFSAFIPLVFRSLVQIEAFIATYVFAAAIHFLPTGLKTMISGGGYGMGLGVVQGNSGFGEGSTLAAVALMLIPLVFYLRKHGTLIPRSPLTDAMFIGLAVVMVACAIGTYARTGLIGLIVLAGAIWLRSDRKILGLIVGAIAALAITHFTSDDWNERVSTINEFQTEDSALGRILVWQWTLGFVSENIFGGGFHSYQINEITFPGNAQFPEGVVTRGKAFHSIYFEVLGEHGWPGIALFLGLILTSFLSLQKAARIGRRTPGMEKVKDLAFALQVSLVVMLACGAFIGVAFQPMLWYIFALSSCTLHYARRASAAVASGDAEGAAARQGRPARTRPAVATRLRAQ